MIDKRDVHVKLIEANGKETVYESPTFNEIVAVRWAQQFYPGCTVTGVMRCEYECE